MLYHPTQDLYHNPAQYGAKPDDVVIPVSEGVKISGWYFHHKGNHPTKATFIVFHGNGQNITSYFTGFVWLLEKDYDFFIFDYRGYGRSDGEPSPENTVEDGKAVIRWAHGQNPKTPLVVYGLSLGGAIGLRTAMDIRSEIPLALVFADSTFSSYKSIGRETLSRHWLTWIFQPITYLVLSDKYAPDEEIKKLSPTPLVVVHGDDDHTVSIEQGRKIYELAAEPKEFWQIAGGKHIDALWSADHENYRRRILTKLSSLGL